MREDGWLTGYGTATGQYDVPAGGAQPRDATGPRSGPGHVFGQGR